MEDSTRAPDVGSVKKNTVLDFLVSSDAFASIHLIASIFDATPTLVKMIQTSESASFAGFKPRTLTEGLPGAIAGVNELLDTLDTIETDRGVRRDFVAASIAALAVQQASIRERLVADGDAPDDDASRAKAAQEDEFSRKATEKKLSKALKAAAHAVQQCKGRKKLQECLNALARKQRFNLVEKPRLAPDSGIFAFLGVVQPSDCTPARALLLTRQWKSHVEAWVKPQGIVSPRDVQQYWEGLTTAAPELVKVALYHWLRPVSSAPVERIFSILTHMDSATRQSMTRRVLHDLLFLRANRKIVTMLAHQQAATMKEKVRSLEPEGAAAVAKRTKAFQASSQRLAESVALSASAGSPAIITADSV
jgi:hypothetical protein